MKKKLFLWFNNISLVYKIMLILGAALTFVLSVYLFSLNIIIREYNKILYEEKAANIKFAITSLETKMREIDKISKYILVNDNIQKRAVELYETKEGARTPVIRREFYNSLLTFNFSNDYIKNIEFVSEMGDIISTGETLSRDLFGSKEIIKSINGNSIWVTSKDGETVNAREIRKIKYMSLDDLGELYISVDFYKMLRDSFQEIGYNINPESLLVRGKDVTLYPVDSMYKEDEIDSIANELEQKKYIT